MAADILRAALVLYMIVTLAAALWYLRGRCLSRGQLLAWAAVAVCLPVLGPFVVIAARPAPALPSRERR